jgi:hypothetical protein
MKSVKTVFLALVLGAVTMSCSGDKKKGIDYNEFKTEVQLTPDQVKVSMRSLKNTKTFRSRTSRLQKHREEIWTVWR